MSICARQSVLVWWDLRLRPVVGNKLALSKVLGWRHPRWKSMVHAPCHEVRSKMYGLDPLEVYLCSSVHLLLTSCPLVLGFWYARTTYLHRMILASSLLLLLLNHSLFILPIFLFTFTIHSLFLSFSVCRLYGSLIQNKIMSSLNFHEDSKRFAGNKFQV